MKPARSMSRLMKRSFHHVTPHRSHCYWWAFMRGTLHRLRADGLGGKSSLQVRAILADTESSSEQTDRDICTSYRAVSFSKRQADLWDWPIQSNPLNMSIQFYGHLSVDYSPRDHHAQSCNCSLPPKPKKSRKIHVRHALHHCLKSS